MLHKIELVYYYNNNNNHLPKHKQKSVQHESES